MTAILGILLAACSAVPSPQSASGARRVYVVERGDSLSEIAASFQVPMRDLAVANGLAAPYTIRPGQRLVLPGTGGAKPPVVVRQAKPSTRPAAPPAAATPTPGPAPTPGYAPLIANTPAMPAPQFAWPGDGALSAGFGKPFNGRANDGIELAIHPGQRILAASGGVVIFAGVEPRFGQLVVIDHGGGWATAYGFTGQITVTEGEAVDSRERIGVSGTGNRMLHFELRRDNVPRDPVPFLPPRL